MEGTHHWLGIFKHDTDIPLIVIQYHYLREILNQQLFQQK